MVTKSEILFEFRNVIDDVNHDYLKFLLSQDVIKIENFSRITTDFYTSNDLIVTVSILTFYKNKSKIYFYIKKNEHDYQHLNFSDEYKQFMNT